MITYIRPSVLPSVRLYVYLSGLGGNAIFSAPNWDIAPILFVQIPLIMSIYSVNILNVCLSVMLQKALLLMDVCLSICKHVKIIGWTLLLYTLYNPSMIHWYPPEVLKLTNVKLSIICSLSPPSPV